MKLELLLIIVLFMIVVSCENESSMKYITKEEANNIVKKETIVKDIVLEDSEFELVKNWKYSEAITKLEDLKSYIKLIKTCKNFTNF